MGSYMVAFVPHMVSNVPSGGPAGPIEIHREAFEFRRSWRQAWHFYNMSLDRIIVQGGKSRNEGWRAVISSTCKGLGKPSFFLDIYTAAC